MQSAVSVWVRDPRIQKNDFWHAYIDYEICLHVSLKKKNHNNAQDGLSHPWNTTVRSLLPVDRQRVLYQEDLQRQEEVQRVRVAPAEAAGQLTAHVKRRLIGI